MKKEHWKPIEGYKNYYEVSSKGRIRSYNGRTRRLAKPRLLKLKWAGKGYRSVSLGAGNYRYVHQLVARAFIPNPLCLPFVNHIDADRTNNEVSNLEWCTQKQNLAHAVKIGTMICQKGEGNFASKLNDNKVKAIRAEWIPYLNTVPKLAKKYQISETTIWNILRGRSWTHVR